MLLLKCNHLRYLTKTFKLNIIRRIYNDKDNRHTQKPNNLDESVLMMQYVRLATQCWNFFYLCICLIASHQRGIAIIIVIEIDQRSLMFYATTTKKCLPRILSVILLHHRHKKPLRACTDTSSRHWHQPCSDTFSRHGNQLRWSWRGGAHAAAVRMMRSGTVANQAHKRLQGR